MREDYISVGNVVCWKCGGSGIDYSKIFSDNDCSRRLCRECEGKGYTKGLVDLRPEVSI